MNTLSLPPHLLSTASSSGHGSFAYPGELDSRRSVNDPGDDRLFTSLFESLTANPWGVTAGPSESPQSSVNGSRPHLWTSGADSVLPSGSQVKPDTGLTKVCGGCRPTVRGALANFSSLEFVGTGDDVLLSRFKVQGPTPRTFLLRAVGPTLSQLGVADGIARPVLTLLSDGFSLTRDAGSDRSKSTQRTPAESLMLVPDRVELAHNMGWGNAENSDDIQEATAAVGAFDLPQGSADSAILAILNPGTYTLEVTGHADTTGVVLVEVYDLDHN